MPVYFWLNWDNHQPSNIVNTWWLLLKYFERPTLIFSEAIWKLFIHLFICSMAYRIWKQAEEFNGTEYWIRVWTADNWCIVTTSRHCLWYTTEIWSVKNGLVVFYAVVPLANLQQCNRLDNFFWTSSMNRIAASTHIANHQK